GQKLQGLFAMALKRIRRGARLKRASPQYLSACLFHRFGREIQTLFRIYGARTGHYDDSFATDFKTILQFNDSVFRVELATDEFIGFGNRGDDFDTRHGIED